MSTADGPPPGQLIGALLGGKIRLDSLLGTGGFGEVYRGHHVLLDRPVAVKVALKTHGTLAKRIQREAQVLMDLRHPNIVHLQDFGRETVGVGDETRDVTYIVQEFVDGQSLKQILNEGRHLDLSSVLEIARQSLDALSAAHRLGYVHRDIKPDNIMVVGPLDDPQVRVLDFGIAGLTDERQLDATELTKQGTFIGTPAYMSPEQFKHEPVGPASDLYSLAVTLFELLARKRPFKARIFVEWAMAHVSEPVPALPASIPGPVSAVVTTAMSKNPADRFPDAAAMREALSNAVEGLPQQPEQAVGLAADVPSADVPSADASSAAEPDPTPCQSEQNAPHGEWDLVEGHALISDTILTPISLETLGETTSSDEADAVIAPADPTYYVEPDQGESREEAFSVSDGDQGTPPGVRSRDASRHDPPPKSDWTAADADTPTPHGSGRDDVDLDFLSGRRWLAAAILLGGLLLAAVAMLDEGAPESEMDAAGVVISDVGRDEDVGQLPDASPDTQPREERRPRRLRPAKPRVESPSAIDRVKAEAQRCECDTAYMLAKSLKPSELRLAEEQLLFHCGARGSVPPCSQQ